MKFFLATLCFTFFIFTGIRLNAQTSVGLRSGINFSKVLHDDKFVDSRFYTAPNFALLINHKINALVSLQIEPGYSQRGTRLNSFLLFRDTCSYPAKTTF